MWALRYVNDPSFYTRTVHLKWYIPQREPHVLGCSFLSEGHLNVVPISE